MVMDHLVDTSEVIRAKHKSRSQRKTAAAEFIEQIKQENAGMSPARMQEIHIAGEFLKSLPELSYQVTKINQWGKHQSRIVKLTSVGIENIRGAVISSMHQYGEVQTASLKNFNTFVIQYLHAEHDYVYRSPVAVQIVHEISTRVALHRSTDKKKSTSHLSFEFTALDEKLADTSISSPSRLKNGLSIPISFNIPDSDSSSDSSSSFLSSLLLSTANNMYDSDDDDATAVTVAVAGAGAGANADADNKPTRKSLAVVRMSCVGERIRTHTSVILNLSSSTSSSLSYSPPSLSSSGGANLTMDETNKRATKLTKVLGTPQETRLHAEVDKLLWNEATPEGRTVHQFVAAFNIIAKSPATCFSMVRRFLDSMRTHIMDTRGEILMKLVVNSAPEFTPEQTTSFIIERSLEQAVVGRLHKSIMNTVTPMYKISDQQLATICAELRGKSQAFFGIPADIESSSGWSASRLEIRQITQAETPSSKLAVILTTAKSVFSTANYEQSVVKKKSCVLSADDFLPIFMHIVVQSEVENLESINQFMWQLCDPTQLLGEGGYYLTVFSSIVSLLHRVHLPSLAGATMLDDAIREEDPNYEAIGPDGKVLHPATQVGGGRWHRKVRFWK